VRIFNRALSLEEVKQLYRNKSVKCDFPLDTDSPCIDVGNNNAVPGYNGLVAHWKMDDDIVSGQPDDTKVADSTGNGNHGTAQQPTHDLQTDGKIDGALNFNGSTDYINVTHTSDLNPGTGSFTICAWIKPDSVTGTQRFIWKNNGVPLFNGYYLMLDGNRVAVGFGDGANKTKTSGGTLETGTWYFVVGVRDTVAKEVWLYLDDGQKISGKTDETGNINYGGNLEIGGCTGSSEYFDGSMDNVMVFNRALSQEEIVALYDHFYIATDINGDNRVVDGDDDKTDTVDMGAYEFNRNISVYPSFFDVTLSTGQTTTETLTISNTGDTSLNFSIQVTGDGL